jgi:hypothetical protein
MSWLLEVIKSILGLTYHLARSATLRDESRPRWVNYSLAGCSYALPVLLIVFFFISWKIAIVVAAAFIVSLVIGAVTEADDVWGSQGVE